MPITVTIGDRDTTTQDVRSNRRVNRQQGRTRVERARNWVGAMRATARAHRLDPLVALESIPGGDHSFSNLMLAHRLADRVFATLFGPASAPAGASAHA